MEFSRPEYWSGLLCPSPADLPGPGIEPAILISSDDMLKELATGPPHFPIQLGVTRGRELVSLSSSQVKFWLLALGPLCELPL